MKYFIGIDIGSTCTKTVVLDEQKQLVKSLLLPTGWSSVDTAETVKKTLAAEGFHIESCPVVATGYGRVSVPYADKTITEISCHAKGAMYLQNSENLLVIDIGGQDTKIICVENGLVKDFVMNDKCSAGTGRFLEVMANSMALRPDELCALAEFGGGVHISSLCTVFAESEVVSLVGRGEKKENIAYAVVDSIVKKVASQVSRIETERMSTCLTGGLCDCEYIRKALGKELHCEIQSQPNSRFAGAIGAALTAMSIKGKGM